MSQQNNNSYYGDIILPSSHPEDLKLLSNELLEHEINYCQSIIANGPEKYKQYICRRLLLAENELERRYLLS